jgi:hypothetical protein
MQRGKERKRRNEIEKAEIEEGEALGSIAYVRAT